MEFKLRKATLDDIEKLISLRIDFLAMEGAPISETENELITCQLREYFSKHLKAGAFVGILAEQSNQIVSAAYLCIRELPGNGSFPSGKTGTLLNVMTYPAYRKKGAATRVLTAVMEEAQKLEVAVVDLMATESGKSLYEKMGFELSEYPAMRKKIL